MRRNMGTSDRIFRVAAGGAVLWLALAGPHTHWGYLGLYPLITGLFGFCPFYKVLHFSTRGMR